MPRQRLDGMIARLTCFGRAVVGANRAPRGRWEQQYISKSPKDVEPTHFLRGNVDL